MDWTDITINIKSQDLETAAAIAQMVVSRGIYIEDYSDFDSQIQQFGPIEIIDEALLKQDRTKARLHIYFSPKENPAEAISYLKEHFTGQNIAYEMDTSFVKDEDWINNWKKHFKPCPIGNRLIIVPTWERDTLPADAKNRIPLLIDPGMAFGSGQHETTRLCMELIEKYASRESHMLDVGTGSGILAITALLLGAKDAVGIDIDALSVKVAAENAALNGVDAHFTSRQGDLARDVTGTFNLITANIVADIIIQLTPDAVKLLAPDGVYIMSGIIEERKADVMKVLEELGLYLLEEKNDRGWCAMAVGKKQKR